MVNPLDLLSSTLQQHPSLPDGPPARTHQQPRRGSIRETFKVVAQILVPLMIGTFTVVIAVQQHNTAKENRRKDSAIATQLREQQFQLDEQRRNQEFQIEEGRRSQDIAIALNKQRDQVFDTYIRELSHLLLISNYRLSRSMLDSIVRPMTLTILRQIDLPRKVLLLKFLYESRMIRRAEGNLLLDLSDADFNNIRIGKMSMKNLSVVGASLVNSSFVSTDLAEADFEGTDLTDSSFIQVDLFEGHFYRARLVRVRFDGSRIGFSDFSLADLTDSNLTEEQLNYGLILNMATLPNGTEGENHTSFYWPDYCSIYKWIVRPTRDSLAISDSCEFLSLSNELRLTHRINFFSDRRLMAEGRALFQFFFQTNQTDEKKIRVDFIYSDMEPNDDPPEKESGFIVQQRCGSRGPAFVEYEMSAKYPRHASTLFLRLYLQRADLYMDFRFFVQHAGYEEYRKTRS